MTRSEARELLSVYFIQITKPTKVVTGQRVNTYDGSGESFDQTFGRKGPYDEGAIMQWIGP